MTKKLKTRTIIAKVIGAVPHFDSYDGVPSWRIRLVAPYFPFHIDSAMGYQTKADAEAVAEQWSKRKVVLRITK